MRVVRASGKNVSPSDDGKLFNKIFSDGLFEAISITALGAALVHIPAMYGIIMGREFVTEAMDFTVKLPSTAGTGYIVVRYDLSTDDIISIVSYTGSYTPTKEDINGTGTVYEMVIATYTASQTAVTNITMQYSLASSNNSSASSFNVSASNWSSETTNVDGTDYYYQVIKLVKVLDIHPQLFLGASGTLPTSEEASAYSCIKYGIVDSAAKELWLYATSVPSSNFVLMAKGIS